MTAHERVYKLVLDMNRPKSREDYPLDPWALKLPYTDIVRVPYSEVSDDLARLGYEGPMTEDGLATYFSGRYYIVWRDDVTGDLLLDVLEHEFAHCACGHVTRGRYKPFTAIDDIEADMFAMEMKADPEALLAFGVRDAEEISTLARVSIETAKGVAQRIVALERQWDAEVERRKSYALVGIAVALVCLLAVLSVAYQAILADKAAAEWRKAQPSVSYIVEKLSEKGERHGEEASPSGDDVGREPQEVAQA